MAELNDEFLDDQENEEEEDDYVGLDDLSIFDNDPDYDPSEQEVVYYAGKLDLDIQNDPPNFLQILYNALKTPLPDNWRRAVHRENGQLFYINLDDQTIHEYSEIDKNAQRCYMENKLQNEKLTL